MGVVPEPQPNRDAAIHHRHEYPIIVRLLDSAIRRLTAIDPCTNVYGLARSLIASSSLLTLLCTNVYVLFRPAAGVPMVPICGGFAGRISLFCLLRHDLPLAKVIAMAGLALVASGWRPRFTGVVHWWVSFSFMASAILVDGGDQVAAVTSLFLIPITLVDRRRWHWQPLSRSEAELSPREEARRMLAGSALSIIRLQVAIIYLDAAAAKCAVPEWMNGTVLYYWLTDPSFGAPNWLHGPVMLLVTNGPALTLVTWSVVALEFSLFAGLLAKERYYPLLLAAGVSLHIGIALLHGLVSFSMIMIGALIIFLRPARDEFRFMLKAPVLLRRARNHYAVRVGRVAAARDLV